MVKVFPVTTIRDWKAWTHKTVMAAVSLNIICSFVEAAYSPKRQTFLLLLRCVVFNVVRQDNKSHRYCSIGHFQCVQALGVVPRNQSKFVDYHEKSQNDHTVRQ